MRREGRKMQPLNGNGLEEACQLDVIEKFLLSSRWQLLCWPRSAQLWLLWSLVLLACFPLLLLLYISVVVVVVVVVV